MKSSVLWRSLILACMASAVVTLLPWPSSRANFLGYNSVCSFTPFATITLLVMSAGIHAHATKQRRMLQGAILTLVMIVGFIGWWFYVFDLPMRTLSFGMSIEYFWIGIDSAVYEGENVSSISFRMIIDNPTDRSVPLFIVEPRGLMINDKRLNSGYSFGCMNGNTRSGDFSMFYEATTLGPHENLTLYVGCALRYSRIEVEGSTRESIWASLMAADFTFTMNGILTARPFFSGQLPLYVEDRATWAARQFAVSQRYS